MNGAALLAFHDDGTVQMYHANGLTYTELSLSLFTSGKIREWTTPHRNGGVASFSNVTSFDLPLFSASRVNRTAIYLLPTKPGAPMQVTQFTDNIEIESESGIDVATVSEWSHDGVEIAIGHSSGKVAIWSKSKTT
jgi:hypothetical protein